MLASKILFSLTLVLIASTSGSLASPQSGQLASIQEVQIDGLRPRIRIIANVPLAFQIVKTEPDLEVKIYGIGLGGVAPVFGFSAGTITLARDGDNVRLTYKAAAPGGCQVRLGKAANTVEIEFGSAP